MEKQQKCSCIEHEEINANFFCGECKVYMCNKCENFHSKLLKNHLIFNLEKENGDIFTGICNEEGHQVKLEYFCKTHNSLCCAACIAKIEKNKNGKHKDCNVCIIEDIKDEMKSKVKKNIKYLENLSNDLEQSIKLLNNVYENIKKDKEELKIKIQKIFTQIRNEINNREDELLSNVDKIFNEIYFNENIIKEVEKLPNKINISLEKNKLINEKYNENNLSLFINNCINIENNIKEINIINEKVKQCNEKLNINFIGENDEELNNILTKIKNFGYLEKTNFTKINNPWTYEKFSNSKDFLYTLKDNFYLAEKTENDNIIHMIKSSYEFKKNKIYKLEFIPTLTKDGEFDIGFADLNDSKHQSRLFGSFKFVALRKDGLTIQGNTKSKTRIENNKKYEFIIDIPNKKFILNVDGNKEGEYNFNFQDNIYAHAAIKKIGNSIRIKTYEK